MSSDFSAESSERTGGIVVVWLATLLFAWPSKGADTNPPPPAAASTQQKTTDLLAGMQKGICYSGFRHGQHPDRGDEEQQKRYYHDLYAWTGKMNITTFFFEAFDEDWKGDPNEPLGAEKHWGLFSTAVNIVVLRNFLVCNYLGHPGWVF